MLTRREFVRNLALVTAGAMAMEKLELLDRLAPRSLFSLGSYWPHLWGDGQHDDTAALQALIDGRRVYSELERREVQMPDGRIHLHGGTYRISEAINITRDGTQISNASIIQVSQEPVFRIPSPRANIAITNGRFIGGSHIWTK